MKKILFLLTFACSLTGFAWERQSVWPKGKMPDAQPQQIAAMTAETSQPKASIPTSSGCLPGMDGEASDAERLLHDSHLGRRLLQHLRQQPHLALDEALHGTGLPMRQLRLSHPSTRRSAHLQDRLGGRSASRPHGAQRGKEARLRPREDWHDKHVGRLASGCLLATSSQTPAYAPVDNLDDVPCHINFAIVNAPAYAATDSEGGTPATRLGYGPDVKLDTIFQFDEKTCPMSLHHGGNDHTAPTPRPLSTARVAQAEDSCRAAPLSRKEGTVPSVWNAA